VISLALVPVLVEEQPVARATVVSEDGLIRAGVRTDSMIGAHPFLKSDTQGGRERLRPNRAARVVCALRVRPIALVHRRR
jgi:hypothetical protein